MVAGEPVYPAMVHSYLTIFVSACPAAHAPLPSTHVEPAGRGISVVGAF